MNKDQRIRDPIHNLISFSENREEDNLLWELLSTTPVQRLRRIKQLGFSEFVYPGATHTRFSHVLGAMQMARRMLDVFEKNNVYKKDSSHELMRKATLSAALLHDIGHGPYSHVFEEIATALKLKKDHEEYTKDLINDNEIRCILEKYNVYNETIKFFEKEPGFNPYTAIISSQMDCDRLDFLSRDRYHTGLRSAMIDLEWLFDSLRIDDVPVDPINGENLFSFTLLPKGISVAEEFVLSYLKMYQNIYFHKTTRSVQHLIREILLDLFNTGASTSSEIKNLPLVEFLTDETKRTTKHYLYLDDSAFLSVIHRVAAGDYGSASILANRYLRRDLFKCIELPKSHTGGVPRALTRNFTELLKQRDIPFMYDIIPSKSYKQYDVMDGNFVKNILVKLNGEYEPLGSVSDALKQLPEKTIRIYFRDDETRARALDTLRECRLKS